MTFLKELLFIKPIFKQMIWGGTRLRTEYGYDIPGDNTGECWAVSAHENGDCEILGGTYDGVKLSTLYAEHKELFNDSHKKFPLLVKIIDAASDLSIQVHPDDEYAFVHENGSYGKTECWYILDCDKDAEIIVGHNAGSKDELIKLIREKRWNELITPKKIKKGDFFQIEPGTVHAIKKGTLILETQQSSDITYRLYDYDRLQNGCLRELHIDKCIDVIKCPHKDTVTDFKVCNKENARITELCDSKFYKVRKIDIKGKVEFEPKATYQIFSCIEGEGTVDSAPVKKGDHFIMPCGYGAYSISGYMSFINSESK